jgi:hypothetical protein
MLFKEDRKIVYKNVVSQYFETKKVGAMVKDLTIQMEVMKGSNPHACNLRSH